MQSASKRKVNKAHVGLKVSKEEEEEGALTDFVLHLLGRVSLHRQGPTRRLPLNFPLSLLLLTNDSDNDAQ